MDASSFNLQGDLKISLRLDNVNEIEEKIFLGYLVMETIFDEHLCVYFMKSIL